MGSSARTSCGAFASARAIATRWFSPPLSAWGRWSTRCRETDCVEQFPCAHPPAPSGDAGERERELDVLQRGELAQQSEVLEDEAHGAAAIRGEMVRVEPRDVDAVDDDRACLWLLEATHERKQRGLARPRGTGDRDHLTHREVGVDTVENHEWSRRSVVPVGEPAHRNRRLPLLSRLHSRTVPAPRAGRPSARRAQVVGRTRARVRCRTREGRRVCGCSRSGSGRCDRPRPVRRPTRRRRS